MFRCEASGSLIIPAVSNAPEQSSGPEELTYEQAIAQVEGIIERIEAGDVGLEESLTQYEQGMALLKRCRTILDRVDQRITELTGSDLPAKATDDEEDGDLPF